jgi:3-oxoacyl-[acyl-carrier protein] reductase
MFDDFNSLGVLITGASTGIGAATAKAFARKGARVAVHYNSSVTAAQSVVDDITATGGFALGRLDVLVNNAGSLTGRHLFMDWDETTFDNVMNLNVRSLIAASQAAVPHLEAQGGGAIVNLGSIAGNDGGGPGSGHYASAKAYVHNLTRHMARDLAKRNIRVNAVAPGVIATPFHDQTPADRMEAMKNATQLGRIGEPEDVVGPILFLASAAMSGYVTGQILHVNGGQLMP